jgi:hypothetical protein
MMLDPTKTLWMLAIVLMMAADLPADPVQESPANDGDGTVTLSGELRRWHPVTLTLAGPAAEETASTFRDYRFQVRFVHASTGTSRTVPGYFAADGSAANSSVDHGNKWRVSFVPGQTGRWTYSTNFRIGADVAVRTDPEAGTVTAYDGITGSFTVEETNKQAPDLRGRGFLEYDGSRYFRYADETRYLGVGPDSPENFLEYTGFDGTTNLRRTDYIRDWDAHVEHWRAGDPTWDGGTPGAAKGKGLIGAINYVASKGMNQQYFITMNVQGDGEAAYPYTPEAASDGRYDVFDVSKLAQWRIVFDHMTRRGMTAHVLLQEVENELLFESGASDDVDNLFRKLYYRELVARFAWHPALIWNLGEEQNHTDNAPHGNAASDAQRLAWATYIRSIDPYDHPTTIHNWQHNQSEYEGLYNAFLGKDIFEGPSLQWDHGIDAEIRRWHEAAAVAGRSWVVMMTEYNGGGQAANDTARATWRKAALWESLMNAAGAVELYFGNAGGVDLTVEDFRPWADAFDQMRFAHVLFTDLPLTEMRGSAEVAEAAGAAYARTTGDGLYLLYWEEASSIGRLDLRGRGGEYEGRWFDPRTGETVHAGSWTGNAVVDLPSPPDHAGRDWALVVRRVTEDR